ncbi:serine/threonine protein kinase [Rhodoferax aquaticus]|uniref:Serine/threonine protein kinase n=1 Tax=Rhodoferax aquaticus TaxID=2527691 RepID=A0A515ESL1_9BURK|nr:serine/threonine protein kinase [Rhodoferax aquaticus]QDL55649.1 serine/threonine protein kinase [Rhodoferax aquaticus]
MLTHNYFVGTLAHSDTAPLRAGDSLGRFVLRKVLGQGAQSTVWLAFDSRMEREVAVKVMRLEAESDTQAIAQWLQEARSASRVVHPHIVPVYEADIQDHHPYLVFEYVPGQTLDQLLHAQGALPPAQAVELMMDVLDAIVVAHEAGVVHRDLKLANVLVDAAGHARVMDFGIAACITDKSSTTPNTPSGGTAGYMSPEAARGDAPSAGMDVFSAGLVLAELLTGKPLIAETDPQRAISRVLHAQLELPADTPADVDDKLRAIVHRAIAQDPSQRYATARDFLADLTQWVKPAGELMPSADGDTHYNATLEFMLRRMRHKSDFPAMSDSVIRIQAMAASENESINSVTNEILKDVALTNKLLRLVNSAHYGRGGTISTVSRAVNLVGFNGIRNMALSLVLLEHMQDKAHAAHLKDEFLRSLMAGSIAAELCPLQQEGEEAFIGAMFQNLGRLLMEFYFPEEARQVHSLMNSARDAVTEDVAAFGVLGLTLEQLGLGVARAWNLPYGIQRCMHKPVGTPPHTPPKDPDERMRWIALVANEIADVLLHGDPKDAPARIAQVTRKYAQAIGIGSAEMQTSTARARQKLIGMAQAMDIHVAKGSVGAQLLTSPEGSSATAGPVLEDTHLGRFELQPTQPALSSAPASSTVKTTRVAEALTAGIQDVTNAMVDDFKLTDVLRMILETMYRAMAFDRVIFCMRDPKTETMTGRFGLGEGVELHVKEFRSQLKASPPDLFAAVCANGSDTMINDAQEAHIAHRLPAWYRKGLQAPTFLLLPLQIKGSPFGLIYADKKTLGTLELDEKELSLLRTLRNQAIMAFKQSS